eukprot:TRINITY_DN76258_c0_g1_i1.p1 TRINITY_DN76258_c0_g1~~TRINITY_DN76258_c0_g1_i1.p1  ORF type:complete len:1011 (-),score=223.75 TRINITY_DN76258_c0_g1_i1:175-3207(-)
MLLLVRTGLSSAAAPPLRKGRSALPQLCQATCRHFAGRASRSGSGALPSKAEEVKRPESAGPEEVAKDAKKPSGPAGTSSGPSALLVLPLLRRPAFPGFYQSLQVSEQEVIEILQTLRRKGQGEYIGGFMTKEPPASDFDVSSGTGAGGVAAAGAPGSGALRRDGGRVANVAELEEVGTVLQIVELNQYPNIAGGQVVVMPRNRIRRTRVVSQPSPHVPLAAVAVEQIEEPETLPEDADARISHAKLSAAFTKLLSASPLHKEKYEQFVQHYDMNNTVKLLDFAAAISMADRQDLQAVLAESDLQKRIEKVTAIMLRDLSFAKLQSEVKGQVEEKVAKEQKTKMLMEQMRQIQKELGIEKDEKQTLATQLREALEGKEVPAEAEKVIEAELSKLNSLEPSSSEFNVCRTYLEWLTALPWGKVDPENRDIAKAEAVLDEDHYGLEDVKERILEHIAVSFLKDNTQGKIMCLVGPPGVGKTSVGKSVARALDRKFYRFSVGGMHDVAEIRGHRRTYVGAMPGKLIQCLKSTGCGNPVVLIDEIDKIGRDMRGDPTSALLEVLDPEQNNTFRDHYLDVPVDLSNVLFLCTANVLDTIPGPLLDRMETIRIAGYVFEEKMAIAKKYLIPQTEEQSGIGAQHLDFQEEALKKLIKEYAREAGVRNLRQLLDKVSRKVALTMVRAKTDESVEQSATVVTPENLSKYIGQPVYLSDRLFTGGMPAGVVMGLAWTSNGGATLCVEARGRLPDGTVKGGMPLPDISGAELAKPEKLHSVFSKGSGGGGNGHMQVTGQLGSVMSESSSISLTYSRLFARELDASNGFLDEAKIHLHVPEGATPKDGPSAGVTMASALISLCLDQPLKAEVAMTGELTLSGKVLKVGGIKEKVIAARREGIKTLLLPRSNEADYVELKEYLRAGITAHFVDHFDDVYRLSFDESKVPALPRPSRGLPVVTVDTPETFSAETPEVLAGSAQEDGGDLQTPAQSSDLPGGIAVPLRTPPLPSSPTAEASGFSS